MMVVCLLSWHTVLSMYDYSFTFNQEDKLVGWIPSTCKWFCPSCTLSVHILVDTNYYHNFLGQFAKICEKLNDFWIEKSADCP